MLRTEVLTSPVLLYVSRAEWGWRKDQIKVAVALDRPTNILNYDPIDGVRTVAALGISATGVGQG